VGWGGGRDRDKRMDMVQLMYAHVCNCKNYTCLNPSRNQRRGDETKRAVEGVNSSMMYLKHCKNLY
jgi:hypothetical protein